MPAQPSQPNPRQRPKSVFQKARAMSYQKLDEFCSKLMIKGAKAKKEAKISVDGDAQHKINEDESLQQLSNRAGKQQAHKADDGNDENETQVSAYPREIAEWRVAARGEYATQRASFESRRTTIENQLYEQYRILELNNFAVNSLTGDYRIRKEKLCAMHNFTTDSTVLKAIDNDTELVKFERERARSDKAAEQASSTIQLLKQKMREERQHHTKIVHMARVQNSKNACRFLKEYIDLSSSNTSRPTQEELCFKIWESVGSITIEEALSGTVDKSILGT